MPWTGDAAIKPKQADFKAWVEHICSISLAGKSHEDRRHLFKVLLGEAWRFSNWLTHAKASSWHDAEAATTTVEHALGLATSLVIRHVRAVPHACPACASTRLSPQRGTHSNAPDVEWERPTCANAAGLAIPHRSFQRPKPKRQIESGNRRRETALFQRHHSASFASPTVEGTELLDPRHKLKQGFNTTLARAIAHGLHDNVPRHGPLALQEETGVHLKIRAVTEAA